MASTKRPQIQRHPLQWPISIRPVHCGFRSPHGQIRNGVDGGQHAVDVEKDQSRTAYLEAQGYRVIRFWNNDVLDRIEGVVNEIERMLADMPSPNPSQIGRAHV